MVILDDTEKLELLIAEGIEPVPCPCCKYPIGGKDAICEMCGWQNVPLDEIAMEELNKYRKEYLKNVPV